MLARAMCSDTCTTRTRRASAWWTVAGPRTTSLEACPCEPGVPGEEALADSRAWATGAARADEADEVSSQEVVSQPEAAGAVDEAATTTEQGVSALARIFGLD